MGEPQITLTLRVTLTHKQLQQILTRTELPQNPTVRQIRHAVRNTIATTGVSRLVYLAMRDTRLAEQQLQTDPDGWRIRSETLRWCLEAARRAFRPRRVPEPTPEPTETAETTPRLIDWLH